MRRPGGGTRVGRILRATLLEDEAKRRPELTRLVRGGELEGVVDAARHHRVIGFAHRGLRETEGVDEQTLAELAALNRQGIRAHLRVVGALQRAHAVLSELDLSWLVVKGPVLTETTYLRPGLRLYYDLDLVVRKERFAEALEALERGGFFLVDRNWDLMRKYMIGELVLAIEHGPEVDVHWDVLYDRELRRMLRVPLDELFERSRQVTVAGLPVRTFDPTDALIHVTMHACKQGGDRLIWLKDIERAIANDPPDWDELVRRALRWRVHLFVGAMLLRSRIGLSSPVPDDVIHELLPDRVWRGTLSTFDRLFPAERSTGFGTPATLLVRSTRPELRSTLAVAGRGVANRTAGFLTAGRLQRDSAQDDPDDPASRAFPTGGEQGRRLYLQELLAEP